MHPLVVEDGLAEGLALPRIANRRIDGAIQIAGRMQRGPQAFDLELFHLVDEATPFFANAVALRHAHRVEKKLGGIRGVHADLADLRRNLHAGSFHRRHDEGLVPVRLAVGGIGQHHAEVGLGAAGGPHLAAVDDVVVAVAARTGAYRGHVGAAADLRHAEAGHHRAADRGGKEFAAQRI